MNETEFDREAYRGVRGAVMRRKERGARLITIIGRDAGDGTVELIYLFEQDGRVEHDRYRILPEWEVDSVADIYAGASTMERENVDLLGLRFEGARPGLFLVPGKSPEAPLRTLPQNPKEAFRDG